MARDLYQILGVRRNAKPETIRAAYRKRAADTHPDRNLNDPAALADYKAVNEAYDVLSDPEKRRRYDATGNADNEPDNRTAALVGMLAGVFQQVVMGLLKSNRNVTSANIVAEMKDVFQRQLDGMQKNADTGKKSLAELRKLGGRFTTAKGEENYLAEITDNEIRCLEKSLAGIEANMVQPRTALEYLKKCSFRQDVQVATPKTLQEILGEGGGKFSFTFKSAFGP